MTWLTVTGVTWGLLALALLLLGTYRATKAEREDDSVHLVGADDRIDEQAEFARKMEGLEKWMKILGVVLVAYGLAILGYWGWSLTLGDAERGMR